MSEWKNIKKMLHDLLLLVRRKRKNVYFSHSGDYEKLYQAVIQVFTCSIFSFAKALLAEKIDLLGQSMV